MSIYGIGSGRSDPTAPNEVQRSLAVPAAMNDLDEELARLDSLTSKLLGRISPLVSPVPPNASDESKPLAPCELASTIYGKSASVRSVNDRLVAALSNLEI